MSDTLPTATRVADPGIRALYRLENRWQAWLDVEVALARAQAELGIIPAAAAEAIAAAARLENMDRARIDEGFARTGHTIVPLVWELGRVVGDPHGGWVHWGATTQNITQTGDLLVLRQAHSDLPAPDRRNPVRHGRPGGTRRRDADRRPHPRPARGARHLRLQGRGLDRRTDPPYRTLPPGRTAAVRRHAGRRGRDLCLARQERAAGAAGHRPAAWLRLDDRAVPRHRRPPGREHHCCSACSPPPAARSAAKSTP